jgi:hypothetical protein
MGTLCQFLALIDDLLPDGSFSHVTQIFIGQTDSVLRLVRLREKDSRAMFAYRLEYTNDAPEVSHVKNRQLQIHVTKMPDARIYVFAASLTRRFFRVCSLKPTVGAKFAKKMIVTYESFIEDSVWDRGALDVLVVQIFCNDVNMRLLLHRFCTLDAETYVRAKTTCYKRAGGVVKYLHFSRDVSLTILFFGHFYLNCYAQPTQT